MSSILPLPRVLLVDDYADFRVTCAELLSEEFAIVGELENALGLVEAVRNLAPDVILLDISMPEINGLDAAERLLEEFPQSEIIFLTASSDPIHVTRAFQIGARGYVLKRSGADLITALHQVLAGKRYLSPALGKLADSASAF